MKIGCVTVVFGKYSFDEALGSIAEAGYKSVAKGMTPFAYWFHEARTRDVPFF